MAEVSLGSRPQTNPDLMVIATRNHGEYILQAGKQHFIETAGDRREVSRALVSRLLSQASSGWDRRSPGTPYAKERRRADRRLSPADRQDRAQGWEPDRFSTAPPQKLTWIDPEGHPGLASDGQFHLVGTRGEVGREYEQSDWVLGTDDNLPSPHGDDAPEDDRPDQS